MARSIEFGVRTGTKGRGRGEKERENEPRHRHLVATTVVGTTAKSQSLLLRSTTYNTAY